jgi:hypothetical protein
MVLHHHLVAAGPEPRLQLRNEAFLLHQSEPLSETVAQRDDGDLLGDSGPAQHHGQHRRLADARDGPICRGTK